MFSGSVGSTGSVRTVLGGRDGRKGRFVGTAPGRPAELVITVCNGTHKFNLMPAKYLGKMNKKEAGKIQEGRKAMILLLGTI